MTTKTGIQWADEVWNPTTGCTRVSAGCKNCYAFTLHDQRHAVNLRAAEMFQQDYMGPLTPLEAVEYARDNFPQQLPMPKQYDVPFTTVQMHDDRLDSPLRKKAPKRIFVNSMSDLFHKDVPDEFIDRVFAVMALTPQHTYQVLTKRPERMRAYVSQERATRPWMFGPAVGFAADHRGFNVGTFVLWKAQQLVEEEKAPKGVSISGICFAGDAGEIEMQWPLPNVWLGVSTEDQRTADARIPLLLETPAAVRFVSYEPALEAVNFGPHPVSPSGGVWHNYLGGSYAGRYGEVGGLGVDDNDYSGIDWVIVGGESGPGARPFDVQWARDTVSQCKAAGVPVFVKQLGSLPYRAHPITLPDEDCPPDWIGKWDRTQGECRHRDDGPDIYQVEPGGGRRYVTRATTLRQGGHNGDIEKWPLDLRVREWPK